MRTGQQDRKVGNPETGWDPGVSQAVLGTADTRGKHAESDFREHGARLYSRLHVLHLLRDSGTPSSGVRGHGGGARCDTGGAINSETTH